MFIRHVTNTFLLDSSASKACQEVQRSKLRSGQAKTVDLADIEDLLLHDRVSYLQQNRLGFTLQNI